MTHSLEQAKRLIGERAELFARNRDQYRNPDYKEAQLRHEFLDPFFEALGWDVSNAQGWSEQYKEVVNEDALKIGGATRAPDYSFRIGGVRKFFAEAKKPALLIKTDASAAYQLRRYAWSAKLPLSILSDFEELAVYDCRARPSDKDKPSVGRINFFTFDQYLDRLSEIYDVFSKEAVLRGSFDRYIQETKGKRGTTPVDAEFLKEIEAWRATLAKNIATNNPRLTLDELNDAVQRTIDRIIFLRMAEDRGAEEYGRLASLAKRASTYRGLLELCHGADAKYNSGLFDFSADALTPQLRIDDEKLSGILADLYYPQSPYEFAVLAADTLGNVYEQFLGKVIRLTPAHQAKIEEKPEVKKAGGVYYTPTYIVDYIVKQTIGKLIDGKSPDEIAALRILDPACGSGSFLLGAYQLLLDHHLNWYVANRDKKLAQNKIYESATGWRLTTAEKKRILLNNIFGVDIDRQAVEVTKLSLLLKVLEDETQETLGKQLSLFKERALPNLDANIRCGNSLIGTDYFVGQLMPDADELRRVNPFDWAREFPEVMRNGGFDCVIGNPPWGAEFREDERSYLVNRYPAIPTKTKDSYLYFVVKAIDTLRVAGILGFIIPNTWLLINNAKDFRRELLSWHVHEIIDHGDGVFKDAVVESATVILTKSRDADGQCRAVRIRKGETVVDHIIEKRSWLEDEFYRIIVDLDKNAQQLLKKLRKQSGTFEQLCTITWGIKPYQVGYGDPPQTREMLENRIYHSDKPKGKDWKPLLVGSDVNRYSLRFPGNQFIKYGKWLMYPSNESLMQQPKILMRQTSDILRACYDDNGYYCQNSVFIVHSNEVNLKYLLGLLNSKLLGFVYKLGNPQIGKVFAEIKPSVMKQLPIRTINFADAADKARHDRVVALVDLMLALHQRLHAAQTAADRELLQRQIDATDAQIDALVYELYGLTEEEVKIIEGTDTQGKSKT